MTSTRIATTDNATHPSAMHRIPLRVKPESRDDDNNISSSRVLKIEDNDDTSVAVPQLALSTVRFLLLVSIGVLVVAALLVVIRGGITIQHNVPDPIGSSINADWYTEVYQTLSGFLTAAFGMLLEVYFAIFLAVMVTFFANAKWHPWDQPTEGNGRVKRIALFWFTPLVMFVINIAISSIFIEHAVTGTRRIFVDDDLLLASVAFSTTATPRPSVLDTILRGAVLNNVVPFTINPNSPCATRNLTRLNQTETGDVVSSFLATIPSITDISATSVSYGFPKYAWLHDAMPHALAPDESVEITFGGNSTGEERTGQFTSFLARANVTYETVMELLVQGITVHGLAESESNAWLDYPCTWVDKLEPLPDDASPSNRSRGIQDPNFPSYTVNDSRSEYAGYRKCWGVSSALPSVRRIVDSKNTSVDKIADELTMSGRRPKEMTLTLETYTISPQIHLVAMTLDVPYKRNAEYRLNIDYDVCTKDGTFKDPKGFKADWIESNGRLLKPGELEQLELELCDPSYYPYDSPDEMCGATSCVFRDESNVIATKAQLLATAYQRGCDVRNLSYNHDVYAWFPANCTSTEDTLFLYGHGTYVSGAFAARPETGPLLQRAQRHTVVSFARLEWTVEDLSVRFDASCEPKGGCDGLIHALSNSNSANKNKNTAQVLLTGADHIPTLHVGRPLQSPLPLVQLNTRRFYYPPDEDVGYTYYVWEHLDLNRLQTDTSKSNNASLGLRNGSCSILIDAYLDQIQANHYYIENPLQPLYTAAIYYLFQNATVKDVVLPRNNTLGVVDLSERVVGSIRMKADKEKKEIRYSIPLVSAISTVLGVVALLIYLGVVLHWPRDPIKLGDKPTLAAQFADVLIDDVYPKRVYKRQLQLGNRDLVDMDDYVVDSITLTYATEPDLAFVMK